MTNREKLQDLENVLYNFCRNDHDRTYKVIKFLKTLIIDDIELKLFFKNCLYQSIDPRSNFFFNDEKWPDITVETNDDNNDNLLKLLDIYELELTIFLKYIDILNL